MGCPTNQVVTHLLFLSVNLQPVSQSSTEVAGYGRVWGQSGICNLHDPADRVWALDLLLFYLCSCNDNDRILSLQCYKKNFCF